MRTPRKSMAHLQPVCNPHKSIKSKFSKIDFWKSFFQRDLRWKYWWKWTLKSREKWPKFSMVFHCGNHFSNPWRFFRNWLHTSFGYVQNATDESSSVTDRENDREESRLPAEERWVHQEVERERGASSATSVCNSLQSRSFFSLLERFSWLMGKAKHFL